MTHLHREIPLRAALWDSRAMSPKWSPDPALDAFRQGVASLRYRGELAGHVATSVEPIWAPFRRQERVWLLVTWPDGRREIDEDYKPWTVVDQLRHGQLTWTTARGDLEFEAEWLGGVAREEAWQRFGILQAVEYYM